MMKVRKMPMLMHHRRMPMPVRMRFPGRVRRAMHMLMVFIMHVAMFVFHRLVNMVMVVPLADCHQPGSGEQLHGDRFVEERYGKDRSQERRGGEIGARSGGPQMPQRQYEQHETDAVA